MIILVFLFFLLVKSQLLMTAISRWLNFHSEFIDKSLNLKFIKKMNRYIDSQPTNKNIMIGSSTIAWMPSKFKNTTFVNLGIPSLCTTHITNNIHLLKDLTFNTVIVYIGVNDTIRNIGASEIAKNIAKILSTINATTVLYIPIIESNYQHFLGSERIEYISQINANVFEQTRYNPNLVFVTPKFQTSDFRFDQLHLNKSGNAHMKKIIEQALSTR